MTDMMPEVCKSPFSPLLAHSTVHVHVRYICMMHVVAHLEVEDDAPEESQGLLAVAVHHSLSHPL